MKYSLLIDITYLCRFHICFPPFFHLMTHAMMLSQTNFKRVSHADVFAIHTFGQWKLIRHFQVNPNTQIIDYPDRNKHYLITIYSLFLSLQSQNKLVLN